MIESRDGSVVPLDQASRRRASGSRAPRPPALDGVEAESPAQAIQSFGWTTWRRPARFVPLLGALYLVMLSDLIVMAWGSPWWALCIIALPLTIVALILGYIARNLITRRRTYTTTDARLAVDATSRGWYIADHIARPGTTGAGHRLRLQVRDQFTTAADDAQVIVYAHTGSDKLARAYMDDIPGLRIAARNKSKILLVRVPRRPAQSEA